jgi:hypothetical protein
VTDRLAVAPGQMIALDALFSNKTPDPFARFAYGSGTVGTTTYADVEFGGIVRMSGGSVTLPTPGGPDELVSVSAPFSFSGTLTGVRGFFEPTVVFSIAPVGHGMRRCCCDRSQTARGAFGSCSGTSRSRSCERDVCPMRRPLADRY